MKSSMSWGSDNCQLPARVKRDLNAKSHEPSSNRILEQAHGMLYDVHVTYDSWYESTTDYQIIKSVLDPGASLWHVTYGSGRELSHDDFYDPLDHEFDGV